MMSLEGACRTGRLADATVSTSLLPVPYLERHAYEWARWGVEEEPVRRRDRPRSSDMPAVSAAQLRHRRVEREWRRAWDRRRRESAILRAPDVRASSPAMRSTGRWRGAQGGRQI
jgi:hypothetical protein